MIKFIVEVYDSVTDEYAVTGDRRDLNDALRTAYSETPCTGYAEIHFQDETDYEMSGGYNTPAMYQAGKVEWIHPSDKNGLKRSIPVFTDDKKRTWLISPGGDVLKYTLRNIRWADGQTYPNTTGQRSGKCSC